MTNPEKCNTPDTANYASELVDTWLLVLWGGTNLAGAAKSLGVTRMTLDRWRRPAGDARGTNPSEETLERIRLEIKEAVSMPSDQFDALLARRTGVPLEELRKNRE